MAADLSAGMIGLGWIAGTHLELLARLGGIKVTGVCDTNQARAAEVAESTGATSYGSWQDLLDKGKPDVLWVCTPPGAHRDPTLGALERGVHVYLEKPIARTSDDASAIVAGAEASKAVCAVGYQWHALDILDDARAALTGQAIGMVIGVGYGPTFGRPWFLNRIEGGGNLLERGSHQVDLIRALAGEVTSVTVAAGGVHLAQDSAPTKGDIEDTAGVLLRLRGGGVATMAVAWLKDGQPGLYSVDVLAADTTLRLNLDPDFTLEGMSRGRPVKAKAARHPIESSVVRFLEAARAGKPELVACIPSDAARTLKVIEACERALASGASVTID